MWSFLWLGETVKDQCRRLLVSLNSSERAKFEYDSVVSLATSSSKKNIIITTPCHQ